MPTPNGANGRDSSGRFTEGNSGGPGNPHGRRVARLRSAMLDAITEDDMKAAITAIIEKAKYGDVAASKILFDRCLGPSVAADFVERIEALERHVQGDR